MATKTWFGGTGSFNDANDWSPPGAPQTGDLAVLTTGTVKLHNQGLSGVDFALEGTSKESEPVLALRNAALNAGVDVRGSGPPEIPGFGEITVAGTVVSAGTISLGSGRGGPTTSLTVDLSPHSTFVNTGSIDQSDISSLSMNVVGGSDDKALFINDGTVTTSSASASFNLPVVGNGTFHLENAVPGFISSLAFHEGVSEGITVDETSPNPVILQLDEPKEFLAAIKGIQSGDRIDLPQSQVTSETFANNELTLFGESGVLASLNIIGDFRTEQFSLQSLPEGGTSVLFNLEPAPSQAGTAALTAMLADNTTMALPNT